MNEIQNNKVNLCDSCSQVYPDCTSKPEDVYLGDGIGHDNICACSEYVPSAQPEIIRCKDCKYWVPGYITDNDDFIPPKCGKWQQMVGHSSDDYCSFAEMRGEQGG